MSERSGGRQQSKQCEQCSDASERANGRASGPVLQSVFLAVLDHSVAFNYYSCSFRKYAMGPKKPMFFFCPPIFDSNKDAITFGLELC